ncbi:MAG: hypothetical protein KGL39_06575, partial [Patescibacteria group bacterium]|nr:hypothetical protein [Patescibacteria group bacterium]
MPLAKLSKPMAFGQLSSPVTSGAVSLTLATGQGARFDAMAAGETMDLMIRDLNASQAQVYDSFTIVRATALSGDTFTIGAWGIDGTNSHNFPLTSGDSPGLVVVELANTLGNLRRFVHGQGALIQATAPTLTSESPENLILTPVADIIQALPTTNVWAGRKF